MDEPLWIRVDAVQRAHARQLARHGGIDGIRDLGLLESAVMRLRHVFAYGTPDLAVLAAAYANGLVRNHPFLDGNKRTALATCRAFLLLNGWAVDATQDEKASQIVRLAASELSEVDFASWLRQRLVART
jgi:death-on-curing protein